MKYRIYLTDYRNRVWREEIKTSDSYDQEKRLKWIRSFLTDKDIRYIYGKDSDSIKNLLTKRFKESGLKLNKRWKDEINTVTEKVSEWNDPEIIASGYLENCKLEMVLYRDFSFSGEKYSNFCPTLVFYDDKDRKYFGGYYQNRFITKENYNDSYTLEAFRKLLEDNSDKKILWGDYFLDMKDNTIKYYEYDKKIIFHIKDKQDISNFWKFIRVNLPTLQELKRIKNLDDIINHEE